MDPDEVNLKLHGLAATTRDYKKVTPAPAAVLHHYRCSSNYFAGSQNRDKIAYSPNWHPL
jgi:hypothetical protein